jgi:acyl-CoA thioesterase-2
MKLTPSIVMASNAKPSSPVCAKGAPSAAGRNALLDLLAVADAPPDAGADAQAAPGLRRFRGECQSIGTPNVYGGHVLAQALMAAARTVPGTRPVHSLHAYFLLSGKHQPIDYEVRALRDGGSFSTRQVVAAQDGAPIFEALASFHKEEASPIARQEPMPPVPGPEKIPSEIEHWQGLQERLPPRWRGKGFFPIGFEFRPLRAIDLFHAPLGEARASIWFKATEAVPDAPLAHQAMLAYASDHGLLLAATQPHGLRPLMGEVQLSSLDHAIWFHRRFRVDDWLLYQIDSPIAAGSRALCRGSVYARDGSLVASVAQEGLMRQTDADRPSRLNPMI